MMKEMRYELRQGEGLNFGRGRRIPLQPFIPKGKPANYNDQNRRGWGTLSYLLNLIQNLKVSAIAFLRLIGLGIGHKCGGYLQETLRQNGIN